MEGQPHISADKTDSESATAWEERRGLGHTPVSVHSARRGPGACWRTDECVQCVRERLDELGHIGGVAGLQHLRHRGLGEVALPHPVGNVLNDARREEDVILRNNPDVPPEVVDVVIPDRLAVQHDAALARVVEPLDQRHARRLSAAGLAHERNLRTSRRPRRVSSPPCRREGEERVSRQSQWQCRALLLMTPWSAARP